MHAVSTLPPLMWPFKPPYGHVCVWGGGGVCLQTGYRASVSSSVTLIDQTEYFTRSACAGIIVPPVGQIVIC